MKSSGDGNAWKQCTRIVVGVIGVIFVVSQFLLNQFLIFVQGIAIFLMWMGVEANYNPELNLLDLHKQTSYTCIVIGVAFMLTSAMGWTAAATKNECLAFGVSYFFVALTKLFSQFGYMALTCFLVCTSLGTSILVEKSILLTQLNEGCGLQSGVIYELDQIFKQGQEILCTDKCPCNVDSGIFASEIAAKMVTDSLGASRLDNCPASAITSAQKSKYYPMLEILETDFQCAGFCTGGTYYLFSDVRSGTPKNGNCKDEIGEMVKKNVTLFGVVLIVIGAIGMVGMIMSFVICGMAQRKRGPESPYNPNKYGMSKDE